MFEIRFYNTLSRSKELFTPLHDMSVGMYQCGPTVYWTQHIGNLRAAVMGDLVVRSLRHLGYDITLVRNYTDVGHLTSDEDAGEDKLEKGARREGTTPEAIAQKYIAQYEDDIAALNILPATIKPRATEHIPEIIDMVQVLLQKGYAYQTDLAVYFDVSSAKEYTRLSHQHEDELRSGAGSGEVSDPQKKNPRDFALWFFKAGVHTHALQTWPSPFSSPLVQHGEGFPGWHIECSAMSKKYLGDVMDIHMGGIEHIPVHHTNEIAQSEGANGVAPARIWLHNEHLLVDNAKMAKSQGTGYALDEVRARGYDPLVLRYFFLQAHYRSKQNFTWEALDAAARGLVNMYTKMRDLPTSEQVLPDNDCMARFDAALADDCNVPQALAIAHDTLNSPLSPEIKRATLLSMDAVLGLCLGEQLPAEIPTDILARAKERTVARLNGDYAAADVIRDELRAKGYEIKDTVDGGRVVRIF
ncbi:MAG: cysteine--tRNA ligase [Candidatus Yonathbacteria bacterium]|nr:cysteine--tRNA ligase [Candidatus Yonathbacteria bacterium]